MKSTAKQFTGYVIDNYIGNFLGFIVGMASTRLVSHFYTTRSIKNVWGLFARKTVVDKQTFSMMEWATSIIIGFIVFEVISKWAKKKIAPYVNKYMPAQLREEEQATTPVTNEQAPEKILQ